LKRSVIIKLFFLLLFFIKALNAQEIREEESLNFSYLGPSLSLGYNQVEYTDWFQTETRTKKMSGYTFSGGLALNIFADNLCGDFQIKYTYNQLDYALTYLESSISGKYLYPFNSLISLGGGLLLTSLMMEALVFNYRLHCSLIPRPALSSLLIFIQD
jgi:hypothetical protein